jgi:mono/diheme cytochrome c family protein
MIRRFLMVLACVLLGAPLLWAADSPRLAWVKAKCALCHGIDGKGETDTGKRVHTPDLRKPEIQKLDDEAMIKAINAGHRGMPSFRKQLSAENVRLLVSYIRGFKEAGPAPAPRRAN